MNDTLGKNGLWKVSADGTGAEKLFRGLAGHPKWSPDVKKTAFNKKMAGNHDFLITDIDINKVKNEHMIMR
jgi:Tol biopolymer transport system component